MTMHYNDLSEMSKRRALKRFAELVYPHNNRMFLQYKDAALRIIERYKYDVYGNIAKI